MELADDSEPVCLILQTMGRIKAGGRFEGHQFDLANATQRESIAKKFKQPALRPELIYLCGN